MRSTSNWGFLVLAAISGALSLAGEAAWLRWAALQGNDDRIAWLLTTLVFCVGGALGAGFGAWRPRTLWVLESLQGLMAIVVGWLVLDGLLYWSVPYWVETIAMAPAAVAIGAHAPLYTRLMSKRAFGQVQALVAAAGVAGVVVFAIVLVGHLAMSTQLLLLGMSSLTVAGLAWITTRHMDFSSGDDFSHPIVDESLKGPMLEDAIAVLLGVLGMWSAAIAMRQVTLMNDADRIASFGLMLGTLTACSIGSWLGSRKPRGRNFYAIASIVSWPVGVVAGAGLQWLLGSGSNPTNALLVLWVISTVLCFPSVFSASWLAASSADTHNEGRKAGRLLTYCAIGNCIGAIAATLFGISAGPVIAFLLAVTLLISWRGGLIKWWSFGLAGAGVVCVLGVIASGLVDPVWVRNRTAYPADMGRIASYTLTSHGLGLYGIEERVYEDGSKERTLTLEGRVQSGLGTPFKYQLGLMSGRYFDAPLRNALEIGVGSGQTLYGLSFIARHIDAVDNDPITPFVMHDLADINGNVLENKDVNFTLGDGMELVRDCEAGHYDLVARIVNGPSSGSALKFYGSEGIEAIKRCLAPDGVYQAYFWQEVAANRQSLDLMLSPLLRNFRHVDIHWSPYLVVMAYDQDRPIIFDPNAMPSLIGAQRKTAFDVAKIEEMPKDAFIRDVVGPMDIPNSIDGGEMERVSRDLYWPRVSGAVVDSYSSLIEGIRSLPAGNGKIEAKLPVPAAKEGRRD